MYETLPTHNYLFPWDEGRVVATVTFFYGVVLMFTLSTSIGVIYIQRIIHVKTKARPAVVSRSLRR